nr:hypothetical protein [Kibdelosporangium sp. MJ126-NF4]
MDYPTQEINPVRRAQTRQALPPPLPPQRRRKGPIVALGAAAAVLVGGGVTAVVLLKSDDKPQAAAPIATNKTMTTMATASVPPSEPPTSPAASSAAATSSTTKSTKATTPSSTAVDEVTTLNSAADRLVVGVMTANKPTLLEVVCDSGRIGEPKKPPPGESIKRAGNAKVTGTTGTVPVKIVASDRTVTENLNARKQNGKWCFTMR